MIKMKRYLSIFLMLTLLLSTVQPAFAEVSASATASSLENFEKIYTYTSGQFTDVLESEWYYSSVVRAYET